MTEKQRLSMIWVDFGCAGHGKGPWDGLGAMLKQRVRRDILHGDIKTKSGYITTPAEVAEHLYNCFSTEEWKADHTNRKVNEIVVLYSSATDMELERARVESWRYDTLDKQKETHSYMPLAEGVVARREGSCFCNPCFGARGRGLGTADSNLCVAGCRCGTKQPWHEQPVQRKDQLGIAERRKAAQKQGHLLADRVESGMWIMSQDRLTDDTIYIGQGFKVKKPDGGQCIYKKVTTRDERINGTQYTRDDYAVAVKWWIKTGDDPEERTYKEWEPTREQIEACGVEQDGDVFFLVNSTELRMVGFQMDAVTPPPRPAAHVAHFTRRARSAPERPDTEGRQFRLPADVENQGLALCW